jgi:hypothetical protein
MPGFQFSIKEAECLGELLILYSSPSSDTDISTSSHVIQNKGCALSKVPSLEMLERVC